MRETNMGNCRPEKTIVDRWHKSKFSLGEIKQLYKSSL